MPHARHADPALDGIRGIAVLMVLLTHAAQGWMGARAIYQDVAGWPASFELPGWMFAIATGGKHGVQLFFVLSAFTLARQGPRITGDLTGYWVRRLARIAPAYWVAGLGYLALAGAAPRLWAPEGVGLGDVAVAAAFGSAWQGGAALAVVPGGWSICCEMTFYAVLPLMLRSSGPGLRGAAQWFAGSLACAGLWAGLGLQRGPFDPVMQLPVFMLGVMAAAHVGAGGRGVPHGFVVGALAAAILVLPLVPGMNQVLLGQMLFAGLCAFAIAGAACRAPRLLEHRVLCGLGRVSYGIYLIHFALLEPCLRLALWVVPGGGAPTLTASFILLSAMSAGAASLAFRVVERPFIAWAARRPHMLAARNAATAL